ncbi:MAG: hypothetical protein OXT51_02615 [Chloroflexota bacterium]|nr:hypothetical protein [Chloroflexota bacterium]
MTTRNAEDLETKIQAAADELDELESANDVKQWWSRHYYELGHKRLGRLLLGQSVERLLERASAGRGDD